MTTSAEPVPRPSDSPDVDREDSPASISPRVVRSRRRLLVIGLIIGVLAGGAWPAYRWWHGYRSRTYKAACLEAVEAKSWERLEAIASRWVTWDQSADDGWIYLAEAAVQLGQVEQATDALGRIRNVYHGALEALAWRGEMLFGDRNRPYEAAATWRRMLEINPRADLAQQRLIYFYSMTLQRPKMLEQIRTAMELNCEPPESYAYFLLAYDLNFSDGLSVTSRWRETYPDDETLEVANALYAAKYSPIKAQALFGESTVAPGDTALINACLEKYPKNLEVLAFHLDYAIYDGDEQRVRDLLSRAPPEAEHDARFWRDRGWYLSSQGLHAEAEAALRKSLELHPVDWRTWQMLANVLRRLQHPEAAKAAELAKSGKDLQRELFELPTAQALDRPMGLKMSQYLKRTGPPLVWQALERRL